MKSTKGYCWYCAELPEPQRSHTLSFLFGYSLPFIHFDSTVVLFPTRLCNSVVGALGACSPEEHFLYFKVTCINVVHF